MCARYVNCPMPFIRVPIIFRRDLLDAWDHPSRIMDSLFASNLCEEYLSSPSLFRGYFLRPCTLANDTASGLSEISNEDKEFKVALNVCQFKPEELEVKVADNCVVIHGKHDEKSDEHGFVSREFTRRYMLPNSCLMESVTSSLSPDGVLTITAPKKAIEALPKQERIVPITSKL